MRKFTKEEKVVFIIGVLVIALLIGLGVTKQYWGKNDKTSFNENVDTVSLIKKEIEIEAGDTFNPDIKTYLKGGEEDIKNFTLDISKVDTKKVGAYSAYFKSDKKKLKLKVKVKDSLAPEISVAVNNMEWVLDGAGSIEDIKKTIKASAIDKADGDISSKITGWPETLPTEAQEVTYTLKVKDAAGHESTVTFIVRYVLAANNQPQQPNSPVQPNQPVQPNPPVQPQQPVQPPVENPEVPTE